MGVRISGWKEVYALCESSSPLTVEDKRQLRKAHQKYVDAIAAGRELTKVDGRRVLMLERRLGRAGVRLAICLAPVLLNNVEYA